MTRKLCAATGASSFFTLLAFQPGFTRVRRSTLYLQTVRRVEERVNSLIPRLTSKIRTDFA